MTATNTSISTEYRDGILIAVPLAAMAAVLMGTFAVVGEDGYAVASEDVGAIGQTCIGIWDNDAENPNAAGTVNGIAHRGKQFLVANSAVDPVTQADFGAPVYIEDNQTIAKTDGAGSRSLAGRFMGFDTQYTGSVWVEIV